MKEKWKDVPDYEGRYQVSNLGRVKSFIGKGRILKNRVLSNSRVIICLYNNNASKEFLLSRLVFKTFNGYLPTKRRVVDHIDNNPLNNRLDNLQDITQRENCSKDKTNKTSVYTGVHKHKKSKRWTASICIDGKCKYIGTYDTEEEARVAYINKLKTIER